MARPPGQTEFLKGPLHAADLIINQYEETGSGQNSQLLWSIASSTLEIPQGISFVSVNELRGELFCNGKRDYKFYGHEAIITEIDQSSSSFQVQGELELTALFTEASIKCQTLAWEPATETLTLGGNVMVTIQSDMLVVSPHLVICNLRSSDSIQTRIPQYFGFSGPIQKLQQLGGSLLFQGPCQIKFKAPYDVKVDRFLGLSKGHRFLLSNIGRVLCFVRRFWMLPDWKAISIEPVLHNVPKMNGSEKCCWTGQEICVDTLDGMQIDMKGGHASLKGPLVVSWPQKDVKLCAGGAEILLKDGTCVLHSQVAAQIQSLKLKASKITWLACQKLLESESFISYKCQSQVLSKLSGSPRSTRVSSAVGDEHFLDNGAGKPQDLPCYPLSGGSLKSLIRSTGLVCQWMNYPKLRSLFSSELKHVVYSDNKFRKVIPMKDMRFSTFSAILESCLRGFFSAHKVSFTSNRFIRSPGFFFGIEIRLWEFLLEKQQGSNTSRDNLKHYVQERVQFCDSSIAIQKAMEDKAKYCQSFNCRNLLVAEGDVDISRA